ncbi:DNA topoisomerase 3 [Allorhodopirellula heiligendammensis]|uniref:DNA topoisomerase n=1 Tax=Allorhodopirellula heiligendammensis TaxID=2714739 RepID=A0A5C6BZ67_9BACT|nr:DNA topoisomerase 3 [Allorhodopirellula heiligendammensis]
MKVILAEKPSVGRDLASFLKANSRRDGYLEGGGYQVTWAFGHLVELVEPGDYDPALKRWTLDSLPFIPEEFELRLRGDDGAKKQFAIIKRLFRAADSLICATDAGREGELIFRYILSLTRCERKPTQRLWLSSLTPSAIGAAFRSIRPLTDYDNLYAAAKCRSQADWVVGLNATRNYTVRYRSRGGNAEGDLSGVKAKRGVRGLLWSLGRVQTPVLAMIVRRDDEIRTFRPEPFWELLTAYRKVNFRYTGDRFTKQADAEQLRSRAAAHPLLIKQVQGRGEKSLPPQLYDLTELQRDMNRRFGISAADTLAAAQSLYESKLITYPRTDSRYLTADMRKEVPSIFQQLSSLKPHEIAELDLGALPFSNRIVNSAKVTDHHAIIPTGSLPSGLNDRAEKVYDAVVVRFIAAFYPACQKEVTVVDAAAGDLPFRARGVRVVVPGWTVLYPRKPKSADADETQTLPAFQTGESGPHQPFVKAGETAPPKHFTENTLLGAMDTAGKLVDEAELREALKEKGLGTPATRAATIETLLQRQYIDRTKKNIVATDLGRYLVAIVKDRNLTSPELTGEWEAKLKQIEAGRLSPHVFMQEIAEYTRDIVRSGDIDRLDHSTYGPCPRCGQPVIAGKRAFGCSGWKAGCPFVLQPNYGGEELSMHQIRELLQLGVTEQPIQPAGRQPFLLGMSASGVLVEIPVPQGDEQERERASKSKPARRKSSHDGEPATSGKTRRSKAARTTSDAKADGDLGACPLCGSPVTETAKAYSCSRWREGCSLTIWKTIAGKRISAATAKKLIRNGQTTTLKGFKSKAGKTFEAKLKLEGGKVGFEFS